jgi:hypothetical protein
MNRVEMLARLRELRIHGYAEKRAARQPLGLWLG